MDANGQRRGGGDGRGPAAVKRRGADCAPPSENVTVPVGVPVREAGLTVAVNVTDCPATDGFADDKRAVVVVVVAVWV